MKRFEIKKAVETIDIDGDIFEIDLSDNKRKEYVMIGYKLQEEAQVIQNKTNSDDITEDEITNLYNDLINITKEAMDKVIGDGAFDIIYPKTNNSILPTVNVLFEVIDYINKKQQEEFNKKKSKYVKSGKNKRG